MDSLKGSCLPPMAVTGTGRDALGRLYPAWRGRSDLRRIMAAVSRIPSLGPRGEGWVALQLASIALVALVGRFDTTSSTVDPGLRMLFQAGGLVIVGLGALFILAGVLVLRGAAAFSVLPHPIEGGELVEGGPYRIVRHPVYAGLILGGLGFALARMSPPTLLATVVLFVVLDLKRRREETWLMERFPGYPAYRARTRALLPFLY
jgi:protein-S-isoprenylcysteine O-methyltransferase Ste14